MRNIEYLNVQVQNQVHVKHTNTMNIPVQHQPILWVNAQSKLFIRKDIVVKSVTQASAKYLLKIKKNLQ